MKLACLIVSFCATSLFAVLPPLAQSTRELQALLTDAHLHEHLGSGELIQNIIRTESGYLVMTRNYLMRVDIQYHPNEQKRVGPAVFELQFNKPVSLQTGELR